MADPVRVFISHHHSLSEDKFTAQLRDDLVASGADVWVDDTQITSGNFVQRINEGLAGRQWLILVMTPQSLRARWVRDEVNAALVQVSKGRMLGALPIVAEPYDDADIPALWDALHRYDATRSYELALFGLLRVLGLTSRSYMIQNAHSNFVLDVLEGDSNDWAPVAQYAAHRGTNQQWRLCPSDRAPEAFTIASVSSGKALDVSFGSKDNGVVVIQYTLHGGPSQLWRLTPVESSGDLFTITSVLSGRVLWPMRYDSSGAPIVQVDHWDDNQGQQWRFVRI